MQQRCQWPKYGEDYCGEVSHIGKQRDVEFDWYIDDDEQRLRAKEVDIGESKTKPLLSGLEVLRDRIMNNGNDVMSVAVPVLSEVL